MSKQDDKHSMAEDYLAQIKWRGEHPYRKGNPPEPEWKYKPVRGKSSSYPRSQFNLSYILLLALIVTAGVALYQMATTNHVNLILVLGAFVLLGLIFLTTRMSN